MFMRVLKSLAGTLLASCMLLSVAIAEPNTASPTTSWKLSGDLEEACSCNIACPCWFKSPPSRMTCDGVQAVFITKGRYGKTPLDGLAVAQFVQSPEGKSMFESYGTWNFANFYIDERANEEQRKALKEISTHLFPMGAKTPQFSFVPITRTIEGADHSVKVGSVGSFSGRLLETSSGSPKIVNPPLADPTHKEFLQGQAAKLTYHDSGQGWNYEHSNYMFNHVKVNNVQYEKFEAEMAKMAAAAPPAGGK